ncbi:hypothetical protein JCM8547_008064 [Rhodosporidiobolus lusitaniae]
MSFSFGAPKPATPTFSFGQPAASTAPTPSLFGSTHAATSQPSTTPSLFGAAPAAGSAAPAAPSLFGQQAASAAPATGGLFGSTPAPPAAGGGLFGSTAPKPAGTGLFGSTPAASAPGTTPSLFGSTAPAAGTTTLFGASQPAAAPSLFGSTAPAAGGGVFGQPAQQPPAAASQPAVTAAPLFGQSQSAATSSLFGPKLAAAPLPTAAPSLFGSTAATTGTLGASTTLIPAPPSLPKLGSPLPPSPNEPCIESRIEAIKLAWDPTSPKCAFQTYFYNEVPVGQSASMYARPPGVSAEGWERARRENPDPERLVPALALGFPSLQKRLASQSTLSQQHLALLQQISTHLSELSSKHSLTSSLRLLRAQQNATALNARLTALVAKSAALSPARNSSVRREEDELRVELEGKLLGEVERLKQRGNELWAGVGALKARKREEGKEGMGEEGWQVADEEGLRRILEILTAQQSGLDHLTRTLQSFAKDVDVMNEAFGLPVGKVGGAGGGKEGR